MVRKTDEQGREIPVVYYNSEPLNYILRFPIRNRTELDRLIASHWETSERYKVLDYKFLTTSNNELTIREALKMKWDISPELKKQLNAARNRKYRKGVSGTDAYQTKVRLLNKKKKIEKEEMMRQLQSNSNAGGCESDTQVPDTADTADTADAESGALGDGPSPLAGPEDSAAENTESQLLDSWSDGGVPPSPLACASNADAIEYSTSSESSDDISSSESDSDGSSSSSNSDSEVEGEENAVATQRRPACRIPNCDGHVRNQFGLIKKHKNKQYCSPSVIESHRLKAKIFQLSTLSEVVEHMLNRKDSMNAYDKVDPLEDFNHRVLRVEEAGVDSVCYHVPLTKAQVREGLGLEDDNSPAPLSIDELQEYLISFLAELRKVYPMHINNYVAEIDNTGAGGAQDEDDGVDSEDESDKKKLSIKADMNFTCYYDKKTTERRTDRVITAHLDSTAPLPCKGKMSIKYIPRLNLLAISHSHKHHKHESKPKLDFSDINGYIKKLEDTMMLFVLPRMTFIEAALLSFSSESINALRKSYDKALSKYYRFHDCEWISMLNLSELHPEKVISYVFYCGDMTGICFILKDVLETMEAVEALSVDTTYNTNSKKSDLFMVNASIDRCGVPFIFMWMYKTDKIYHDVAKYYRNQKTFRNFTPTLEKPLPQCQSAISIQEEVMSVKLLQGREESPLMACCLRLVGGTRLPGEECSNVPQRPVATPEPYHFIPALNYHPPNTTAAKFWNELPPERPLKHFRGVTSPLVIMDKDFKIIHAVRVAMPKAKKLLCQWHTLRAVGAHCDKRKSFKTCSRFFRDKAEDWPSEFAFAAPYFSKEAFDTHDKDSCAEYYGLPPGEFHCICHDRAYYENHFNEKNMNKEYMIVGGKKRRLSKVLKEMMKRHSRVHHTYPQSFPFLDKTQAIDPDMMHRSKEDIIKSCQYEMISFCVKNELFTTLLYLWENWYNYDMFILWTTVGMVEYNPFTTNMISEGNHSKLKRKLELGSGLRRLDRVLFMLLVTLHADYKKRAFHLTQGLLHDKLWDTKNLVSRTWVKKRWRVVKSMHDQLSGESFTDIDFELDCATQGTDVINFRCGCYEYLDSNVHICRHLLKGLNANFQVHRGRNQSVFRVTLRARKTAPFYLIPGLPEHFKFFLEPGSHIHTWVGAELHPKYLDFRRGIGADILSSLRADVDFSNSHQLPPAQRYAIRDLEYRSEAHEDEMEPVMETALNAMEQFVKSLRHRRKKLPYLEERVIKFTPNIHQFYASLIRSAEIQEDKRKNKRVKDWGRTNSMDAMVDRINPEIRDKMLSEVDSRTLTNLSTYLEMDDIGHRKKKVKR